jgi:hypothetical protein
MWHNNSPRFGWHNHDQTTGKLEVCPARDAQPGCSVGHRKHTKDRSAQVAQIRFRNQR